MAIENLKKHSGQLKNTGVRVAVVFRKIPTDDSFCLIVETERLPDSYHDTVIQCLNSRESFETNEFYEVLNRRTFPDGLNCLTALHQKGFLRKEPVDNIVMLPLPNQPVPLSLINATIVGKVDEYKARASGQAVNKVEDTRSPEEKARAAAEIAARMQGDSQSLAKELLAQAESLEEVAAGKREEAYQLAPNLKPGRGRPPTPEEIKEQKLDERKQRRRERDQQKAANAKAEKAAAALEKKVADKIARDEIRANTA
jgi:hypothetical protein